MMAQSSAVTPAAAAATETEAGDGSDEGEAAIAGFVQ